MSKEIDDFYNYLRDMVKSAMKERGVSKKDLAEQSNISYSSINNYLNGKTFCLQPSNFTRVLNILHLQERVYFLMIGYSLGREEVKDK